MASGSSPLLQDIVSYCAHEEATLTELSGLSSGKKRGGMLGDQDGIEGRKGELGIITFHCKHA